MWESHADDTDNLRNCHSPDRPRAVYQVVNVNTDSRPKVASEDSDVLRNLWPTSPVSPPRAAPIPSDSELLIQRAVVQERSSITDIEILLQSLLPVGSVVEENVGLPAVRQEPTAVCFLCGESSHVTSRCPVLDESFPFLPPGWRVDRTDDEFVLRPPPRGTDRHQAGNVD